MTGYADDYYKMYKVYNYCSCCGYENVTEHVYDEKTKLWSIEIEEKYGYGVFQLSKGDKYDSLIILNASLTKEELIEYTLQYNTMGTNKEK